MNCDRCGHFLPEKAKKQYFKKECPQPLDRFMLFDEVCMKCLYEWNMMSHHLMELENGDLVYANGELHRKAGEW